MTKVVKEEGLKKVVGWIIGGALDLVGNGAFGVWKYFNTKEMDNFVLFALVFFSIIGAMMIIGALIYWAYYVLSETAKVEYTRIDAAIDAEKERINKEIADEKLRIDAEKLRIDAEKLRIDKLEKRLVSEAYDTDDWAPADQKQNVFFILRKEIKTANEALSSEIKAANDEIAKTNVCIGKRKESTDADFNAHSNRIDDSYTKLSARIVKLETALNINQK